MLAAVDETDLDQDAVRVLRLTLRDFKRAGVDRDESTRTRLAELADRETVIGQEFSKNIREDVRTIHVSTEELAGLPDDYVANHPADHDGLHEITTDYPDIYPFLTFASSARRAQAGARGLLEPRLARQRRTAARAARPARRARQHPRIPGLGRVRRRGKDDRDRTGERAASPEVRQSARSSTRSSPPRSRRHCAIATYCSTGCGSTIPTRDRHRPRRLDLLRRGHPQRAFRGRRPGASHVFRLREGPCRVSWPRPVGFRADYTEVPDAHLLASTMCGLRRRHRRPIRTAAPLRGSDGSTWSRQRRRLLRAGLLRPVRAVLAQ